jgi:hypothetical protein
LSRALWATLDLFQHVARLVAEQLRYSYPDETERFVKRQIQMIM